MKNLHQLTAKTFLYLGFTLLFAQCNDNDGELPVRDEPHAAGLMYASAPNNADSVYSNITDALEQNSAIGVVAEVNHSQNAANAGLELRPTRVLLFGNPKLGTPLMQANQLAGLDLPQKILVYENEQGDVYVAYNAVAYVASRYGVDTVATLPKIKDALSTLVQNSTGTEVVTPADVTVPKNEGVKSVQSMNSFADTYLKLKEAIAANQNLNIVAELDHQQNAKSVGMDLNPTKLIVFGNPALGTPLMQKEQTIGIDLPQKMLVYQDSRGTVQIAYNDPYYLAKRHGISEGNQSLEKIAAALEGLATEAAK